MQSFYGEFSETGRNRFFPFIVSAITVARGEQAEIYKYSGWFPR